MSNSINGLPPGLDALAAARLQAESKKSNGALGQEDFLKLMVTQMKNQDPSKPMDPSEMLSQMAQFGTVSGIGDLQKSFATLAGSLQSNQALQASTMVGREVLIENNKLKLADGANPSFGVELTKPASQVRVSISDGSGQVVRTLSMGQTAAGIQDVSWDGKNAEGVRLPAGKYTLKVEAMVDNKLEAATSLVRVPVESVSLPRNGAGPTLNLADYAAVNMDAVRRVF